MFWHGGGFTQGNAGQFFLQAQYFSKRGMVVARPGGPNTVVMCINNTTLNELGTGGITRPAMFYAPAAGKDAKVRNAKPPHQVFPEY